MEEKKFERILLPTDFSEASEAAAKYALTLAKQFKARLYVLHVVNLTEDARGLYVPHLSFEKLNEEMKEAAGKMLEKFVARAIRGYKDIETRVLAGEPHKEILKTVKGTKIDCVVMGSSGKGKLDRYLFGSTAERVLRKAGCPVLIVPSGE